MEIKANSWYRTRGGEIAYVAAIVPFGHFVVIGLVRDEVECWTIAGAYHVDDTNVMDLIEHLPDCDGFEWKPKPTYEPFANAAEFAPHRDRWVMRLDGDGCYRFIGYDDTGVWTVNGTRYTYKEFLRFRFDDNTPCGRVKQ